MLSKNDYTTLLTYRNGSVSASITEESQRHMNLRQQGFIEAASYGEDASQIYVSAYQLTPQGEDALCEFEESTHQHAKAEKQQRFDNQIAIAGILVSLVSFFSGVFAEYHLDISLLILSLFQ